MKLKLLIIICLTSSLSSIAQWTSRAVFPGVARAKATSFTIDSKIYVLGGVTNASVTLNDFWEYDILADSWTQKPNFPGQERYGAVSFVLGNTGYVATGGNDNGFLDDMWQYDPVNSHWTQRTGLPAGSAQHENQRTEAFAFVVNNKAYLGGGNGFVFGANSTGNIAFADLWEYDPANNSWVTKSGFPDFIGRNMSVAGAINGKGYIGLGCNVNQTMTHSTFWEYSPDSDSWVSKAVFPNDFTTDAGAFVLDSSMYVIGGVKLSPVGMSDQVYRYDVHTDTWTQLPAFNGGPVAGQFAIASGSRAFSGGGYTSSIIPRNDVWEFTSAATGIEKLNAKDGVIIYPNPSGDHISFQSKDEISSIESYDMTGKKIFANTNSERIDISGLPAGIYQVKINFKNGNSSWNRFVKSDF